MQVSSYIQVRDTVNEIFVVYGNDFTSIQTVRSWFRNFRWLPHELTDSNKPAYFFIHQK